MDSYDIVAVFLGVMFTLRKLDTQSRTAAQQPHVAPDDFALWQRQSVKAYTPGAYASFARVVFHFAYIRYAVHHPLPPLAFARGALLVDFVWVICVVTTLYRANATGKLGRRLGIVMQKPTPSR